ncbi:MAG TPA: hypothetical protein VFP35_00830 [Candidatus Saccharimonadales bacterium]|nr:hypothetical protein [Candidatus Saccharimonadales bacterium]
MKQAKNEKGQILISLIIVAPSLMLIAASYLALSVNSLRLAIADQMHTQAQIAADAGVDYSVEQLNQDSTWSGVSETVLHSGDTYVKTTFSASLTSNSAVSDTLTVIGRAYNPSTASSPSASVTLKVDLRAVTTGNFSIVSGEGGLNMDNSSKIVAGDIFINGTISLSNTAQIGLSTNPVNVNVADQTCPAQSDPNFNTTYPRVCTSADGFPQPIVIQNSGKIYGTVKANNQTDGTNMSNPGLTASSGVTAQPLPTYDRASQKAAVANTISGGFSCNSGSQTWPANTHITGDVTIGGSCKVTVQGDIWIDGSLSLTNSSQLIVADSLASTRPNIMVDGLDGVSLSNTAKLASNSSGTGFEVYTFYSTASCSPDCTSLDGTDAYNSRSINTISLTNNTSAPQSILYSYWTGVSISNAGAIGALLGQTINLSNSGTITFGTAVPTGSSTFWVISGYRRSY